MSKELFIKAITRYFAGLILVCLLLFIPAGTINFINGWIFIGILFIPMFIAGIIMMFKNPKLLELRLNAKETESDQKEVILGSAIMFILGFVVAGLNFRFKWFILPDYVVLIASIVFILDYLLYAEVLRENTYLARTVEVVDNQKVIDTGMYGIVRHPMYSITILLFLMMPLVLGSIFSFIIFLIYPFLIIKRINNEEKVLAKDLKGYKAYQKKVKYKLFPYIW